MAEAELSTIARPYARAAFSRALETGSLDDWSVMLQVTAGVSVEETVSEALDNPRLSAGEKATLLIDVLGDTLNDEGGNFLHILADHDRLAVLPAISELFDQLKAHHEKTVDVEIISAFDLSDEEESRLAESLHRRLERNIHLKTSVDTSLLGGVVVRTEDTVIDNSVRARLQKLSQALA